MSLIRLYRVDTEDGTGWSLEPWRGDSPQTVEYYKVPDGVTVVTDKMDDSTILMLLDHKGEACGICERYGRPCLYSINFCGGKMPVLEPADRPSDHSN